VSWIQRLKRLEQGGTHTQHPQSEVNAPILTTQDLLTLTEEYDQLSAHKTPSNMADSPFSHAMRQGEQLSPFTGSGFEYQESRPYQIGDEIRRINWPLMAKTGKAYTKYFQEERQANCFILVDHRHTMRFGTRTRLKATQASRIAGYFTWLTQQSTIPVVGARLTNQLEQTPVLEGRGSYEKIMQLFSAPCPPYSHRAKSAPHDAQLNDVLLDLLPQIQMGTQLILISDFQDINSQTTQRLIALQQRAMITAICIQDPAEHSLPAIHGLQLHSMETSSTLNFDTETKRHAYQTWAQQHQRTLQSYLQQAGISPFTLQSNQALSTLSQVNHAQ
jgi:hypothetical protein